MSTEGKLVEFHKVKTILMKPLAQGLEGYFRDPGFDQNTVRDSGKRKRSYRDSGFDCYQGSGIPQNSGTGAGFCCLSVGNSGNRHDPNKRYSGKPGERKILIERANLRLKFISFCRN